MYLKVKVLKENFNHDVKRENFYEDLNSRIIYYNKYESLSVGSRLSKNLILTDNRGKETSIKDMISNNTLFFRFSETHCSTCLPFFVELLRKVVVNKDFNKVVVLCDFANFREFQALCLEYKIEIPIYNVSQKLNFPIDNVGVPYFFVSSIDLVCYNFQIAAKDAPRFVETYLESVFENKNLF